MPRNEEEVEVHTDAAGGMIVHDLVVPPVAEETVDAPVDDYPEVETVIRTAEEVATAEGDKASTRSPGHLSAAEERGEVEVTD